MAGYYNKTQETEGVLRGRGGLVPGESGRSTGITPNGKGV